jgi:hypothetical protein
MPVKNILNIGIVATVFNNITIIKINYYKTLRLKFFYIIYNFTIISNYFLRII